MKLPNQWSPAAVIYIIATIGLVLFVLTLVRHPPVLGPGAFSEHNITAFFADVTLILTLLSPALALAAKLYIDTKTAVIGKTAAAAHEKAAATETAVNGPLSAGTANAIAAGIAAYASGGDVDAAKQAALKEMVKRDVPTSNAGSGAPAGSGGSGAGHTV